MTLTRITEREARDLMTMFPNYFGKLNPPASADYYYGEYPWSGGGAMLFYAIPVRSYQNVFFRLKLMTLVLAGVNAGENYITGPE